MDATQLYSSTLEELNQALVKMTSPEWDALVQAAPPDQRGQALTELLRVQQARLVLGNAVLQDIVEKLKANEQALLDGIKAVQSALNTEATVDSVLKAVGSLIDVIAKVAPLL
jgi:hypothetical protein